MSTETSGPASDELLRVKCGGSCGKLANSGILVITPGAIRWEIVGWQRRLAPAVLHGVPPLTFKRPRLTPPWIRYALVVQGEEALFALYFSPMKIKRVLAALDAAQISYAEERTWFDIGNGEASQSPETTRLR